MPSRALPLRLAVVLVALGLLLPMTPGWAHHASPPGPVHAGNTFGWYPAAWRQEFIGPIDSAWKKRGAGVVKTKNGMLTIYGRRGTISATLDRAGHATGRWEVRWKSKQYRGDRTPYRVRTELVPAGDRKQYCGARNIALESYVHRHRRAQFYIHNLPDLSFNASKAGRFSGDRWHTFAVEVTTEHISWFVDAHVVATERRPEALSGVPFTVRFSLTAVPGKAMNRTRMQMDWLRYWSLAKPNDQSIAAPAPVQGTYRKACPPTA